MEEFLYLSSYPFANDREVGEMPGWTVYRLPDRFAPNPRLQRLFVQKILARAQFTPSAPVGEVASGSRLSDSAQIWLALTRLEKQIQAALPDMSPAVSQARGNLFPSLPQGSQKRVGGIIDAQNRPVLSFDEQVEAAEKDTNPAARERLLALAVLGARAEMLDHVLRAADKILDSSLRDQVVGLVYLFRAQAAIKDKRLDEARKLAEKVWEIDRRAYLYLTIAEEFLRLTDDQSRARETLEEVSAAVKNAPCTIVSARAFLGLTHLFSKIEGNRSVELLGNAVSCINHLEAPDFSSQYVQIKVEGKDFGFYTGFQTPGFGPENAFREVGKVRVDE
jgi:tetratricopeptide (TPR) repeat protein